MRGQGIHDVVHHEINGKQKQTAEYIEYTTKAYAYLYEVQIITDPSEDIDVIRWKPNSYRYGD